MTTLTLWLSDLLDVDDRGHDRDEQRVRERMRWLQAVETLVYTDEKGLDPGTASL